MPKKQKINYGLKISKPKPEDYVFGANSPIPTDVIQQDGQWDEFLPVEERQAPNGFETQGCVSFGTLNCVEILLKKLYNI